MDIKIKFGWSKGIRTITEMCISMDTKYILNNAQFVQEIGEAINKVVNTEGGSCDQESLEGNQVNEE